MFVLSAIPLAANTFEIQPLPNELKSRMMDLNIWKADCPIDIDRLRLVEFTHFDFFGEERQGQLVVLEAVAERVMTIFKTLHQYKFPISQAKTIDEYGGHDKPSMAANNSTAFNYRPIAGKTLISVHSYGVAIDINPIQNPCIELQEITDREEVLVSVQPAEGQGYLNRTNVRLGMAEQILDKGTGMRVVDLFFQNGFHVWGGKWNYPVDWQHFQPSRGMAEWLGFMSPVDAIETFELYITNSTLLDDADVRSLDFKSLYEKNSKSFMQILITQNLMGKPAKDAYISMIK